MTSDVPVVTWRRSSHSGKQGNCVELAHFPDATTAIRDSHDPDGPILSWSVARLAEFVTAAGNGEFSA